MLSAGMKHKVHDDVLLVILYMRPVLPVSIRPLTKQKTGDWLRQGRYHLHVLRRPVSCHVLRCHVVSDPERCWQRGAGGDQCPGRWGVEGNSM